MVYKEGKYKHERRAYREADRIVSRKKGQIISVTYRSFRWVVAYILPKYGKGDA